MPAGHCGLPHSPSPPGCPPELAAPALRAAVPPRPVAVNTGWNLLLVKDSLLENHRPHRLKPPARPPAMLQGRQSLWDPPSARLHPLYHLWQLPAD